MQLRFSSVPLVGAILTVLAVLVNTGGPSLAGLAVISLAVCVVGISVLTNGSRR